MSKLIEAATKAKEDGYEYMTSVVKSVFNTTYHNVNKIDDIIEAGKWIPANYYNGSWHGPVGIINVPDNSINKSDAISKYCK